MAIRLLEISRKESRSKISRNRAGTVDSSDVGELCRRRWLNGVELAVTFADKAILNCAGKIPARDRAPRIEALLQGNHGAVGGIRVIDGDELTVPGANETVRDIRGVEVEARNITVVVDGGRPSALERAGARAWIIHLDVAAIGLADKTMQNFVYFLVETSDGAPRIQAHGIGTVEITGSGVSIRLAEFCDSAF